MAPALRPGTCVCSSVSRRSVRTTSLASRAVSLPIARTYHGSEYKTRAQRPVSTSSRRPLHQTSTKEIAVSMDQPWPSSPSLFNDAVTQSPGYGPLGTTPAPSPPQTTKRKAPLQVLPLATVLRSFVITSVSSSRMLLPTSLASMAILAHAKSAWLNPDRNPVLRFFIRHTVYNQFCAGENSSEVRRTISHLKDIGYSGVILCYAKEVVMAKDAEKTLTSDLSLQESIRQQVIPWAKGTMETVKMATAGDFVALKFSGAGKQTLYELANRLSPSPVLSEAMEAICAEAASRGVRLFVDAEQDSIQAGIDDWTLELMRKFNRDGKAVIYGTYQTYLKAAPRVVAEHIAIAQREGFTLGVKLVRGAYLGSDPRHIIHDTKADTDACYDGIAEAVLRKAWTGPMAAFRPAGETDVAFPRVDLAVATHNADSVQKARLILESGVQDAVAPSDRPDVSFAQLQGMADEVSCELLSSDKPAAAPSAYKYLVWGSTGECMAYLLRRAYENRDAVQRTVGSRNAMGAELWRRFRAAIGVPGS